MAVKKLSALVNVSISALTDLDSSSFASIDLKTEENSIIITNCDPHFFTSFYNIVYVRFYITIIIP